MSRSSQHLNSDDPRVSFLARGNKEADEAAREEADLAPRPVGTSATYKQIHTDVQAVLSFVADLAVRT
eukprot:7670044-Pyramimonas_sp.AAC.1